MFQELSKMLKSSLPKGCATQELRILGSEDFVRGFRGAVLILHRKHDVIAGPSESVEKVMKFNGIQ